MSPDTAPGTAADAALMTKLEAVFAPLAGRDRWVLGQLGQSLDGRIATRTGDSHYINGPEDLTRLHQARALADAVVVGAGTVASDDPRLTVRRVAGDHPVRVVLDGRDRLGVDRHVFSVDDARTLWLVGPASTRDPGSGLAGRVERVPLPTRADGTFQPTTVLRALEDRGLLRVLVEGGGRTVSDFLAAGVLDRLHLSVAPLLIGSGRPGISLPPVDALSDALRTPVRHHQLGNDLLFDLDLASLRTPAPPADP
jgi:riboflavin-specific deaminase-like protein